jgi:hypothetical protein
MFPFAANKRKFAVSVFRKQTEVAVSYQFSFLYIQNRHKQNSIYKLQYCFKQKMENGNLAIFLVPFAHRANENLSFFHLLMKKQTEVICLQRGLNGPAHPGL